MIWTVYVRHASSGDWCKVEYAEHPRVDANKMRIIRSGSVGPRIKSMPVNQDGKTLSDLKA